MVSNLGMFFRGLGIFLLAVVLNVALIFGLGFVMASAWNGLVGSEQVSALQTGALLLAGRLVLWFMQAPFPLFRASSHDEEVEDDPEEEQVPTLAFYRIEDYRQQQAEPYEELVWDENEQAYVNALGEVVETDGGRRN